MLPIVLQLVRVVIIVILASVCHLACCGLRSTACGCFCAGWLMLGLRSIAGSRRPVLLLRWVVKWERHMASVLH